MRALLTIAVLLAATAATAQTRSPYLEDYTWPELRDAVAGGMTTAVIASGGIEQNGPHMAFIKHNLIARHVSGEVARRLNGIAYPVIPFSLAGDPIEKTNHSRWPGISSEVFVGLVRQVAVAARAAGFKTIVLLGDHGGGTGGGQGELALVAQGLDADWRGGGVRVVYASNAGSGAAATAYLKERNIAAGGHAGMAETAQILALDDKKAYIRADKYPAMAAGPDTATGAAPVNLAPATAEMGRAFLEMKVTDTVAQVRKALGAVK